MQNRYLTDVRLKPNTLAHGSKQTKQPQRDRTHLVAFYLYMCTAYLCKTKQLSLLSLLYWVLNKLAGGEIDSEAMLKHRNFEIKMKRYKGSYKGTFSNPHFNVGAIKHVSIDLKLRGFSWTKTS